MISLDTGLWQRGPSGSFSPLSLSPALWLDASDASTLFQSNGGAAAAADGDPVGYWLDKSGNAKHASQTDGTMKPLLKLNSQNAKNGILADGVNDYIRSALNMNGWTGVTYFVVGKPVTTGIAIGNYSTAGGIFTGFTNTAVDFGGRLHGGSYASSTITYSSSYSARIMTGGYDGTNITVQNNNGSAVSVAASTPGTIICQTNLDIFANTHSSAATYRNGVMYELVILNYFATTTQITNMVSFLNTKWNLF